MKNHELTQLLEVLHTELSALEQLPADQAAKARTLASDIARLLNPETADTVASGNPIEGSLRDSGRFVTSPDGDQEVATESDASGSPKLLEQAREAVEHFGESHPRLARAMADIADALARAGI